LLRRPSIAYKELANPRRRMNLFRALSYAVFFQAMAFLLPLLWFNCNGSDEIAPWVSADESGLSSEWSKPGMHMHIHLYGVDSAGAHTMKKDWKAWWGFPIPFCGFEASVSSPGRTDQRVVSTGVMLAEREISSGHGGSGIITAPPCWSLPSSVALDCLAISSAAALFLGLVMSLFIEVVRAVLRRKPTMGTAYLLALAGLLSPLVCVLVSLAPCFIDNPTAGCKRSTRFVDACAGPCGDSDHTHCVISSDRLRILHRWDRSRLSAAAFAPSVGLSAWTLYSWRRQARLAEGKPIGHTPSTAAEAHTHSGAVGMVV